MDLDSTSKFKREIRDFTTVIVIEIPDTVKFVEIPRKGSRLLCVECQRKLDAALKDW